MMATMTTIVTNFVMREAWIQATKEMCKYCAHLNNPEHRGDEWVHVTGNVGENRIEYECYAGPIHALIEKLNEVK